MTICPYCANEIQDAAVSDQTIPPAPLPLSPEDLEMARAFHASDARTRTIVALALGVPLPDRRRHPLFRPSADGGQTFVGPQLLAEAVRTLNQVARCETLAPWTLCLGRSPSCFCWSRAG
jgi:hypothetical protein